MFLLLFSIAYSIAYLFSAAVKNALDGEFDIAEVRLKFGLRLIHIN